MARSRNIKPGFFKNEDLAECSFPARLCFIGLWTLADRAGRLEDRPKRIKGELFAYDSVEVEPLLAELAQRGFILRYRDAASLGLIQIITFKKHQSPHHKELKSVLASPQSLGLLQDEYSEEAPDKSETSPGLAGNEHAEQGGETALIPDTGFLNPDSGTLNPDSLSADGASKSPRPSRKCPKSFLVEAELQRWAREEVPNVDIRAETAKFRDHTFKTAISEWDGAWRNWMRRASEGSPAGRGNRQEAIEERNRTVADRWAAQDEEIAQ